MRRLAAGLGAVLVFAGCRSALPPVDGPVRHAESGLVLPAEAAGARARRQPGADPRVLTLGYLADDGRRVWLTLRPPRHRAREGLALDAELASALAPLLVGAEGRTRTRRLRPDLRIAGEVVDLRAAELRDPRDPQALRAVVCGAWGGTVIEARMDYAFHRRAETLALLRAIFAGIEPTREPAEPGIDAPPLSRGPGPPPSRGSAPPPPRAA